MTAFAPCSRRKPRPSGCAPAAVRPGFGCGGARRQPRTAALGCSAKARGVAGAPRERGRAGRGAGPAWPCPPHSRSPADTCWLPPLAPRPGRTRGAGRPRRLPAASQCLRCRPWSLSRAPVPVAQALSGLSPRHARGLRVRGISPPHLGGPQVGPAGASAFLLRSASIGTGRAGGDGAEIRTRNTGRGLAQRRGSILRPAQGAGSSGAAGTARFKSVHRLFQNQTGSSTGNLASFMAGNYEH